MSKARSRKRFRNPIGILIIVYKGVLGAAELAIGAVLLIPSLHPAALFHRLTAEELREDPSDRFVALVSRHLPSLIAHRYLVAVGLVVLGVAKLVAAVAMWQGKDWGPYLLLVLVVLLLPFDIRQAVVDPTAAHVLLAAANLAVAGVLVIVSR